MEKGDWNLRNAKDERSVEIFSSKRKTEITAPATDEAKQWEGYGTAIKPAWEPIILAMKPLRGTFAANALEHGVAGLNIDGSRIGANGSPGRWPANVALGHDPECQLIGVK